MYNQPISLEERILICNYIEKNQNYKEIAALLQRNPQTISKEIKKHSINGKYDAYDAHNQFLQNRIERFRRVSAGLKKFHAEHSRIGANSSLTDRMTALEMQVEILIDLLKEIKDDNTKNK